MSIKRKIISVILGILGILCVFYLLGFLLAPMSQERIEKGFYNDYENIRIVRDFLMELEDESIYITSSSKTMFTNTEKTSMPSDNSAAISAIDRLFSRGYEVISKGDNCICFLRWNNLDAGRGVAYLIDGNTPSEQELMFLTYLQPLDIDGWYYYEEDFNEWKRRNQ